MHTRTVYMSVCIVSIVCMFEIMRGGHLVIKKKREQY